MIIPAKLYSFSSSRLWIKTSKRRQTQADGRYSASGNFCSCQHRSKIVDQSVMAPVNNITTFQGIMGKGTHSVKLST